MPLNTNLIMGYQPAQIESPVNQLAKVLQIQGAQQANELNQQKMDEYSRGVAQQNRLLQLTQGIPADATDEDRVKAYRVGGFHDQADKLETAIGTRAKTAADVAKTKSETDYKAIETAHKKADLAGQVFGYVRQNPTPENAIAAIEHLTNVGMYTPEQAQAHIAKIQANPQNVAQMADLAYRGALSAKDQLPKLQALNAGDAQVNQSVDPVTGLVRETGRTAINQSADNKANNQRIAAEGAANRAVQIRGQNLVDSRAAKTAEQKVNPKPLPASALKMQQESLDAIGTASAINADLGAIESQIEGGKLSFGPVSNAISSARNAVGMSTEESRNLASFRTNLEKLRNDSLRLNKGVQTDGDAQRAWNELFQNINDTALVKQRLGEIKRLNERAVQLRKMDIDGIRANYNQPELDVGGYTNQPATLNGGKAGNASSSKTVNFGDLK
jgi:hypothetical protein